MSCATGESGAAGCGGRAVMKPRANRAAPRGAQGEIEEVLEQRSLVVVLTGWRTPSTWRRSCAPRKWAFKVHVIENPRAPFRPNSKVAGCDKWLDIEVHRSFEDCRACSSGRLSPHGLRREPKRQTCTRFRGKLALVFGNERIGVSPEALAERRAF